MMISLKNIVMEGIHGKFWWMNPSGKLIDVLKAEPQIGHRETATELLIAMGITPSKDIFKQMYELGWLRISYVGNQGRYTIEFITIANKRPTITQFNVLKDLAIELNAYEIRDGSTKKTYAVGDWA